ncbi:hypothetical protein BvCms13BK_02115 [Escherichia coli]|nr:hypothetical protein BvCms13BK_02115 [Escherichia coli]
MEFSVIFFLGYHWSYYHLILKINNNRSNKKPKQNRHSVIYIGIFISRIYIPVYLQWQYIFRTMGSWPVCYSDSTEYSI